MKKKIIIFVFSIVFLLALAKIALVGKLATTGTQLAQIEAQIQVLTEESDIYNEAIIESSSLSKISTGAARIGMVKTDKVVSLTPKVPVALRKLP